MRKQETVVVPSWEGNRDAGKHFIITEMPAAQAEKWALRAFLALKGTAGEVPPEVMSMGMVAVAWRGLNTFLAADVDPAKIGAVLDEMMTCVKIIRDPRAVDKNTGGVVATEIVSDDDIEEVQTRLWLRSEVLRVHTGFSPADALFRLLSLASAVPQASPTT